MESRQPCDETFALLADFALIALWDHAVRESRWIDAGPPTPGNRLSVRTSVLGRVMDLEFEVMELLPAWVVVVRADTSRFTRVDSFMLEENAGGCSVLYERAIRLSDEKFDSAVRVALKRDMRYLRAGLDRLLNR